MVEKTVTVLNEHGIHCRPSTEILMKSNEYPDCSLFVESNGVKIDIDSMLSLLGLGLTCGDDVTIIADGENELEACDSIATLFEYHFDFPTNE